MTKREHFSVLIEDLGADATAILFAPASNVDTNDIAFMLTHTCGLLAVTVTPDRAKELQIPVLPQQDGRPQWGVTVDARDGISTGVSAADRATTVALLGREETVASQLVRPGHTLVAIDGPPGKAAWVGPAAALSRAVSSDVTGSAAVFGQLLTASGACQSAHEAEKFAADGGFNVNRASDLFAEAVKQGAQLQAASRDGEESAAVLTFRLEFDGTVHHALMPREDTFKDRNGASIEGACHVTICAEWRQACADCRYQVLTGLRRAYVPVIAVVDPHAHRCDSGLATRSAGQFELDVAYERAVVGAIDALMRAGPLDVRREAHSAERRIRWQRTADQYKD